MQQPPESPPIKAGAIVFALWLVMFTTACQFLIVAPILPRIGEELNVPDANLGLLVTGYAAAVAVFALIAGPVSDHFGRRLVLRVGTATMAVSLLAHGLADSFAMLLGLRVLAGISSGILSGATVAYIGDVLPYHRRGWALGWIMSGMAFGQIAGIPLGTIAAGAIGFQVPFVAFGVIMVVAWGGTMHVLVAPPRRERPPLTVASGLATYASLLKQPELLAVTVASTTMMLGVSTYIVYEPAWLESAMGASPEQVAGLFLFGGIANAATGPIAGRLSDKVGRKAMVVVSSVVLAVLMAATTYMPSIYAIYVLAFVLMTAVGARISPLNAWMTALVDEHRRGTLLSLTMATGQMGFALGAAIAGWTYVGAGYRSSTFMGMAAALVTAGLLWAFVPEPDGQAGQPAPAGA